MVTTKRILVALAFFGGLAPIAHSIPDRGERLPEAPVEPFVALSCPPGLVARGEQPTIILLAINPTARQVNFEVDERLHFDAIKGGIGIRTAGTAIRLAPWIPKGIGDLPVHTRGIRSEVGIVEPFERRDCVTGLDPFVVDSLLPGAYRLPYEMMFTFRIRGADGRWSDQISRHAAGVLEFTVSE